MADFPEFIRIPLGDWTDSAMNWLLTHAGGFFEAIGNFILQIMIYIEKFWLWVPWYVLIPVIFLVCWRLLGVVYGLVLAAMLFLIGTFGYWKFSMMTLSLVTGGRAPVTLDRYSGGHCHVQKRPARINNKTIAGTPCRPCPASCTSSRP